MRLPLIERKCFILPNVRQANEQHTHRESVTEREREGEREGGREEASLLIDCQLLVKSFRVFVKWRQQKLLRCKRDGNTESKQRAE